MEVRPHVLFSMVQVRCQLCWIELLIILKVASYLPCGTRTTICQQMNSVQSLEVTTQVRIGWQMKIWVFSGILHGENFRPRWDFLGWNFPCCVWVFVASIFTLCLISGYPDLYPALYRLSVFFRTSLFLADFLCKITGTCSRFHGEPFSKVLWYRLFCSSWSENHCKSILPSMYGYSGGGANKLSN